jgi:hypothetical protein
LLKIKEVRYKDRLPHSKPTFSQVLIEFFSRKRDRKVNLSEHSYEKSKVVKSCLFKKKIEDRKSSTAANPILQ